MVSNDINTKSGESDKIKISWKVIFVGPKCILFYLG